MYGFGTWLNLPFETVLERVTQALQAEGFGVLTDIDMQATMKAKLNADMQPYRILGACNPPMAHRALETDPEVGLLLPCNVVIRQLPDHRIHVSFMDPAAVLRLVNHPGIDELAGEVKTRLQRVCDSLTD